MSENPPKYKKKLTPPTHLDPMYLFDKYELLRLSVFKKFRNHMANEEDKNELRSAIDMCFLQLVDEYNPNVEVDFPYYIKKMLELRVYHFVSKYLKNVNKETYSEDDIILVDENWENTFNKIIDLNSFDDTLVLGEKHRSLLVGVLIQHKTLKELAEEEGVPVDRLHARLYFLIKKLKENHAEKVRKNDGEDLY
ncbi:RNA polymerase sigma factor, sigma-70 family [Exiguobacterium phage vB_EalM-132]|nr:RNA polymerase sigma factor, sigma-70 family [Exiguobacterium phage vB_EalM-132]